MRRTLEQGLPELGMGSGLIPRLAGFAELVLERNQVMNLTAITEPKDVAALHLLDSLELAALGGGGGGASSFFRESRLIPFTMQNTTKAIIRKLIMA